MHRFRLFQVPTECYKFHRLLVNTTNQCTVLPHQHLLPEIYRLTSDLPRCLFVWLLQSYLCVFTNPDPILSIPKSAEHSTSPVSKQG